MARIPTEQEAELERKRAETDRQIRELRKQQFTKKWVKSSETERAEMLFDALQEKADKYHSHPRVMY